jgi:DNA (cytosine-5)-methyltransferase 1
MFWKEDERWLWPTFLQVIKWIEPRWVIIENVEGIRTRGLDDILGTLADSGYDAEWDRLSAQAFGAPHQRQRYFIVAYPEGQYVSKHPAIYRKPSCVGAAFYTSCDPRSRRLYEVGSATVAEVASPFMGTGWWRTEPDVDRMAYGIPDFVDRYRVLGNAVVPQVAEWVGRRIMESV